MNLQVVFKNVPTPAQNESLVVEKFEKLVKYLSHFAEDAIQSSVIISMPTEYLYEINYKLELPGEHISAQEADKDFGRAVVACRDSAERQLKAYLEKLNAKK